MKIITISKVSFVVSFFLFFVSLIFSSCKQANLVNVTPATSINIRSKRIECSTFLQKYNSNDLFVFNFPGTLPDLGLSLRLVNPGETSSLSLSMNFGSTHTVADAGGTFNIAASLLTKAAITDFLNNLKLPPTNFSDIETNSSAYFINFKVEDIVKASDSLKYLVITLSATKKVGNVESNASANLKTNPCPPCSK